MSQKPEILAPAGNLEKLKVAVSYGADAVYVGGQRYGLRARADNFTDVELKKGIDFAHQRNAKVYVTLNAYLHDEDFEGLSEYSQFLQSIGVDAVIVSDLGVMRTVSKSSDLRIHLSTQASCLNSYSAKLWKSFGVSRIVLGRETSIVEAGRIAREAGVEVEIFIHGALCMAYSGNCTISNFTAGRDSNRGGCIQSCRFGYDQVPQGSTKTVLPILASEPVHTPFMSSKDLQGTEVVPELFAHGIHSLKIEGRMKSPFYVASACKTYRALIDSYAQEQFSNEDLEIAQAALAAVPNRGYCGGSFIEPAGADSVVEREEGEVSTYKYLGMVVDATSDALFVRLHAPLQRGERIEFLPHQEKPISITVEELQTVRGGTLDAARQDSVVRIPRSLDLRDVAAMQIVRMAQEM